MTMKSIRITILVACTMISAFSCKEPEIPLAKQTDIILNVVSITATSAKIDVTYDGDTPYYIRVMKAEQKNNISIDLEDKDALAAYVNTHSTLSTIPTQITAAGLETLIEHICGVVAFNTRNEIIGVSYISFTTQASEDAVGDEGGAGSIEIVTL